MSVDLDQFRGKRALVCFQHPVEDYELDAGKLAHAAVPFGACYCHTSREPDEHIADIVARERIDAILLWPEYQRAGAAHAAGVPVLRVRRDGSVEVDEP